MTTEPDRMVSKPVELENSSTTTIIISGIIMAAVILGFSVIPSLTTSLSRGHYTDVSQLKRALCTSKVLELAQKGMVRDTVSYYSALSECMAMKSTGSIYGEAGAI